MKHLKPSTSLGYGLKLKLSLVFVCVISFAGAQVVTTLAGASVAGKTNGTGAEAHFNAPYGVVADGRGNLYVADYNNNEIRKIVISSGVVSTLAGTTKAGFADGIGTAASFNGPAGITTDGRGNLYVADLINTEIRKIVISTGVVTTLAGSTAAGAADGTGSAASFYYPSGVVADGNGNLYVSDGYNNEIRKIVISTGVVTTLAGSVAGGHADGTGTAASFNGPRGIAMDRNGNLYVADFDNNEIRKIVVSSGVVTTLAGSIIAGSVDGIGTAAKFDYPIGVAIDGNDNLYVGDENNNEIRKIVISTGVVTTLAGSTVAGSADGTRAAASFYYPTGITTDGNGNLYVADLSNNEIRKVTAPIISIAQFSVLNSQLTIYPYYANQLVYVKLPEPVQCATSIKVLDIMDKEVMTVNNTVCDDKEMSLDISGLAPGIYFIRVTSDNAARAIKFVKE
jgi:streptogramin lyase